MIEIRLLGALRVVGPDGGDLETVARQPKRAALIAYLAMARPRGFHPRDKLLALFWPELDAPHARNALSQALHVIRRSLGDDALCARGDDVSLAFDRLRCDVLEFEQALERGAPADAMQVYQGDLLDGYFVSDAPAFEEWLDAERRRLRQRASAGAWALAQSRVMARDGAGAEGWVSRALALGAIDEGELRELLQALGGGDQRTIALRIADEFTRHLASEYQVEPSEATRALIEGLRKAAGRWFPPPAPAGAKAVVDPLAPGVAAPRWRPRFMRRALVVGATAALIAVVYAATKRSATPAPSRLPLVVVLPLRNLGGEQGGYFAGAVTEEVQTRLAAIGSLNVVGGQQLVPQGASGRTQQQIAELLGADYVLDGSVTWLPRARGTGALRVLIQLTPGRDGVAGWGNVFEQEITSMDEVSALYAELAQRVVNHLDVVLRSPGALVASAGTRSLDAYDDYLRGREFMRRTAISINHLAAIQLFQRAIERDSAFALAWGWLGGAHVSAYWVGGLPHTHLDSAKAALDRALALDASLAQTHTSLGQYYNVCCEDYARARYHVNRAIAHTPSDARLLNTLGILQKRDGAMTDAIVTFRRAAQVDRLWSWPNDNLGHTQLWLRRYDAADSTFLRSLSAQPQNPFAYAHRALVLLLRDGDIAGATRVLDDGARYSEGLRDVRLPFDLAMMSRDYRRALAQLHPPEPGLTRSLLDEWLVSDRVRGGLARRFAGDAAGARLSFDSARGELERALSQQQASRRVQLWLRSGLAIALAGLGDTARARPHIAFVEQADPLKVDAIEGSKYLLHAAVACVLLGDRDCAIDILERVVASPGLVSEHSLRLEPYWHSLRADPRFMRLRVRRL